MILLIIFYLCWFYLCKQSSWKILENILLSLAKTTTLKCLSSSWMTIFYSPRISTLLQSDDICNAFDISVWSPPWHLPGNWPLCRFSTSFHLFIQRIKWVIPQIPHMPTYFLPPKTMGFLFNLYLDTSFTFYLQLELIMQPLYPVIRYHVPLYSNSLEPLSCYVAETFKVF